MFQTTNQYIHIYIYIQYCIPVIGQPVTSNHPQTQSETICAARHRCARWWPWRCLTNGAMGHSQRWNWVTPSFDVLWIDIYICILCIYRTWLIWAPVKLIYIWVVATIGCRFLGGHIVLQCLVSISLLGGGISLDSVSCTSMTNACNTKVVFNHFDRDPYTCMLYTLTSYILYIQCIYV